MVLVLALAMEQGPFALPNLRSWRAMLLTLLEMCILMHSWVNQAVIDAGGSGCWGVVLDWQRRSPSLS